MNSVAVVGSRSFTNYELLKAKLDEIHASTPIDCIVSGGARGADQLGERWAKENGVDTKIFYPEWKKFGRAAGPIRNKDIVDNAVLVLAFWNGTSTGTLSTIKLTEKAGKNLIIVGF